VRGLYPLLKRELFAMFVTPLAWVLIVAFLVLQGLHFNLLVLNFSQQMEMSADQGPVQAFFGQTILLYVPLAALATYVVMWAPTALYMVILRRTGEIDWHVVATGYLGVLGIGAGYIAIGILASAMTKSQLLALVFATVVLVALFIIGIGDLVLPDGVARDICGYVSAWSQMDDFSKGIVDLRRLVFDATLIVLPLFVTVRVVDSWRWG